MRKTSQMSVCQFLQTFLFIDLITEIPMKLKKLVLILCLWQSVTIFAQQRVNGIVTDVEKRPIPGLTVLERGTGNGVITDVDGLYSISVANEQSVLVFSFIGMETQEIEVGGQSVLNVVMRETLTDLDELVVIGYGVQRKSRI